MEELDGNGAAGALGEVFALEITAARGQCDGCGNVAALAEARAYVDAPGLVIRCRECDNVLVVLVRGDDRYWLGVQGVSWLELAKR
jgi:phage FluMu protein Com